MAKTKHKKKRHDDDGDDDDDYVRTDDGAVLAAAEERKKKKKRNREAATMIDIATLNGDDGEEEEEVEEEDEDELVREKKRRRTKREHKRVSGYRSKAFESGFAVSPNGNGFDILASCITPADAKRLMTFVPENLNKTSYERCEAFERLQLSTESVPLSAAIVTQGKCESFLRFAVNEAVLRAVEKGSMRVDAATMHSVLRPYSGASGLFTCILPPPGLIKHAANMGKISAISNDIDEGAIDDEKATCKELSRAAKKIEEEIIKRKEAFKQRKLDLAKERAANKVKMVC